MCRDGRTDGRVPPNVRYSSCTRPVVLRKTHGTLSQKKRKTSYYIQTNYIMMYTSSAPHNSYTKHEARKLVVVQTSHRNSFTLRHTQAYNSTVPRVPITPSPYVTTPPPPHFDLPSPVVCRVSIRDEYMYVYVRKTSACRTCLPLSRTHVQYIHICGCLRVVFHVRV